MADLNTANTDTILRSLQNAGVVMYGPTFNVQQYSHMSADQLRNFALPSFRDHLNNGTYYAEQTSAERFNPDGTKRLGEVIAARKAALFSGEASGTEIQNYESLAMVMGGFEMNIDGQLNGDEVDDMNRFLSSLESGTLKTTFDNNISTRAAEIEAAAAEAAAQAEAQAAQTELTSQVASGLVYSNFLDAADINDPQAVAVAFNNMLAEHRDDPGINIYELQGKAFVDPDNDNWNLSAESSAIFNNLNDRAAISAQFGADLESNDAARVTTAQHYINLKSENDIEVTGTVTPETLRSAETLINADVAIEGIPATSINSMAAQGQLLLPDDATVKGILSEDAYGYYETLFSEADRGTGTFGASKEQFLANTLITQHPAEYEAFLKAHNGAPEQTLDVAVALPTMTTDFLPDTPEGQILEAAYVEVSLDPNANGLDISAVGNNAFGVEATDTTIIGGASFLSETLDNEAIAQTPDGEMVFTDQYLVVDQIATSIASSSVVDAENPAITMGDALIAYQSVSQTMDDVFKGNGEGPTELMYHGQRISEVLGYDRGHEFDLQNPEEFSNLMSGVLAYAKQNDIPGDGNYIQNFIALRDAGDTTVVALGQDIQMVAEARINGAALPEGTQFAVTHGIIEDTINEVSPETVMVAEDPVAAEPLKQTAMDINDPDVAEFYRDEIEQNQTIISPVAAGLTAPTQAPTLCLTDKFTLCTQNIVTDTPPAGMDIENPANANLSVANPDIFDGGQSGGQSQMKSGLNLGF